MRTTIIQPNVGDIEDDVFEIISNAYSTGYHSGYPGTNAIKNDANKIFTLFERYKNKKANKRMQADN